MTGRAEKGARCAEATDDPAPPASAGDTTTAISITTPDPADEVRRLRGPIEDLRLVIGTLASVGQLRRRFTDVRGITTEPGEPGEPLDSFGPVSDTTGDAVADAARLGAEFDRLHEHADALWFERQWLTAQSTWPGPHWAAQGAQASTGQPADRPDRLSDPGQRTRVERE